MSNSDIWLDGSAVFFADGDDFGDGGGDAGFSSVIFFVFDSTFFTSDAENALIIRSITSNRKYKATGL